MLFIVALLVFLTIYTLFNALRSRKDTDKVDLQGRLRNVLDVEDAADEREAELRRPLSERIVTPFLGIVSSLATRFLPAEILNSLEKKVKQLGRQRGLAARDYLALKVMFACALPLLVFIFSHGVWTFKTISFTVLALLIGWTLPSMQLDKNIQQRHDLLEKTFPDTLDLLSVSVEAGLGFDGALVKVVEKSRGPVAEEFKRLLQEIKMGKSRKEALRDFGARCNVDDIIMFTSTIIQADQLGLNIGNTLKTQADQMRRKRRQRVEEKAMKVPVKMLIPLIVFVFPTIFIVLLGPAVIQILENFVVN